MAATARCWLSSANASWRSRRDAPALGDVLGGLAHRVRVVALGEARVDEPPAEGRVGHLARAAVVGRLGLELDVRRPGHRFDAAADEHVAVADRDRVGRRVDRLEPRAAQPVDGQPADLDREVGEEQRHPGDVAVVLAGLVRAAEDDVLDERRVEAGAVDDRAQDGGGEIVRPDASRARRRSGRSACGRPRRSRPRGAGGRVAGHAAIVRAAAGRPAISSAQPRRLTGPRPAPGRVRTGARRARSAAARRGRPPGRPGCRPARTARPDGPRPGAARGRCRRRSRRPRRAPGTPR